MKIKISNRNCILNPEQIQWAYEKLKQGYRPDEVGAALHATGRTVTNTLRRNGLSTERCLPPLKYTGPTEFRFVEED